MPFENLQATGYALIFAGIVILIASIYFQGKNSRSETGGIILLGPIPIAWGSLKSQDSMRFLSIFGLLLVIIYVIWLFLTPKK